jgi:hypothetical protein
VEVVRQPEKSTKSTTPTMRGAAPDDAMGPFQESLFGHFWLIH